MGRRDATDEQLVGRLLAPPDLDDGVESLDYWRRRLRDQGVIIEKEMAWPRGGHSIYFRDPAGNSVELITPGLWGLRSGW